MKKTVAIFAMVVCCAVFSFAAQDQMPRQRPMPVIKDTFSFVPGSWADYNLFDKKEKETIRMYIATLEKEIVKGVPYSWLEIEVETKDTPVVVTKVLAEETKDGPGKIMKAIVHVAGYSPFNVPKKYLEGPDQQVGQFDTAQILKRLEQKTIVHKGRSISAMTVEAEDSKGGKTEATISVQILPIAIYQAETDDMRMTLTDFGSGAKSKITEAPISFTMWIFETIMKGLSEIKK